jgi:uncharacterized cupin superfamily protein
MANARRHPQVVSLNEIDARNIGMGSKFGASTKQLGLATGARSIGCSWYEVSPGKAAFPHHFHCANEESLFVLEGEGTMRIGKETVAVRSGDYITFAIGPESAHQLRNTGSSPLRYLCFSTIHTAEIVGYPDSKKIGAMAAPSMEAALRGADWVRFLVFEGDSVGYYDGEDVG